MAQTDFGSLSTQQKKVWSALVFSAGRDQSFFLGTNGFLSSGLKDSSKPIHLVDELTATERGAKCVLPLVLDMTEDGVVGDNQLENNEEALVVDDIEIQIDQLRHGAKNKGRMSEQKTVVRFRAQAKDKLAYWKANKTDEILFLTASGVSFSNTLTGSSRTATSQLPSLAFAADVSAPTSNRAVYGGDATTTGTLTTADKMTWNLLLKSKAQAVRRRLKPIRIEGKDCYVTVMSPEQARDLCQDPDYKAAVAHAAPRGKNNNLFTGALAMVHGLVLYEHQKVYSTIDAASGSKWGASGTVEGAQALLMGAQALGYARIGEATWGESDNTDYGNKQGVAYSCMIGAIKTKFKSIYDNSTTQDFSLISIYTAAKQ